MKVAVSPLTSNDLLGCPLKRKRRLFTHHFRKSERRHQNTHDLPLAAHFQKRNILNVLARRDGRFSVSRKLAFNFDRCAAFGYVNRRNFLLW